MHHQYYSSLNPQNKGLEGYPTNHNPLPQRKTPKDQRLSNNKVGYPSKAQSKKRGINVVIGKE
jgi:hypothetical protein